MIASSESIDLHFLESGQGDSLGSPIRVVTSTIYWAFLLKLKQNKTKCLLLENVLYIEIYNTRKVKNEIITVDLCRTILSLRVLVKSLFIPRR